ncbi:hypothetical protein NP493_1744g00059 [Ridgeia piscesae]|uniref:Fibrinogen C-terminal domain-containing protein n=1 Tax=Ridgeia piscesae TaxID=27915 RepID=A0AAD9JVQ2_RIDPI|nr:hypothetical protein NP493_1744g00059 [Ridgeia piscesae]
MRRNRSESLDFDRPWTDYITGFGDPRSEFWVGLDPAVRLVAGLELILRHDVITSDRARRLALYSGFRLGDASLRYPLSYSAFLSTQSTAANGHINMSVFQTPDRSTGCARNVTSAGWFLSSANNNSCYRSILFGSFDGSRTDVTWEATSASVVYVDMKYRASTFRTGTRLNVLE